MFVKVILMEGFNICDKTPVYPSFFPLAPQPTIINTQARINT